RLPQVAARELRFECTRCGACCRREGVVWLKPGEVRRLARHLGLKVAEARARFVTTLRDGRERIDVSSAGCPLLSGDLCTVDPVKPDQCGAYPFWHELVADPEAWREERSECEGIDRGPPVKPAVLARMLRIDPGPDGPILKKRRT